MAGWKIELSDDLTQTVPAYRGSQISTVSGHCLHFRSICSSKNCFAYQSSLVKSGKPPLLTAVYAQNKAKIWFILEECTKESNK